MSGTRGAADGWHTETTLGVRHEASRHGMRWDEQAIRALFGENFWKHLQKTLDELHGKTNENES